MIFNPSAQTKIQIGDTLIAVGQRGNMDRLVELLGAGGIIQPRHIKTWRKNITDDHCG